MSAKQRQGRGAGGPGTRKRSASSRKAHAEAARKKRERNQRLAFSAIAGVVVVAGLMVILALARPAQQSQQSGSAGKAADLAQSVPDSVLNQIGAGSGVTPPHALPASTPPLEVDGKPEVIYLGAEYCPYCAAERWPLVVALSRFGHFTNLGGTASSASDIYPNTETFTFHGATYASDTVAFTSVETADNAGKPLEQPTQEQQALISQYDRPPYTDQAGAIPFIMIGNKFVSIGASYSPSVLAGKSRDEIAAALSDPTSAIARSVGGAANTLTAAICRTTGGAPVSVCSSAGVKAADATLPAS